MDQCAPPWTIGIEISPRQIVGGVVEWVTGAVVRRLDVPLPAGGAAAGDTCAAVVREVAGSSRVETLGLALDPRVELDGPLADLPTPRVLAPDRAAALAEARRGAGVGLDCFVYVHLDDTAGAVVVRHGVPWDGHCAGALRSSPAAHAAAAEGRTATATLVAEPATDLGAEIGWLVDLADPDGMIVGGTFGLDPAFRRQWIDEMRDRVWDPRASVVPVVAGGLGSDAALVGAALAAGEAPTQASNTLLRNR